MAWVQFRADFHYRPAVPIWITYKAGELRNVPRVAAHAAIEAGKAEAAPAHAVRAQRQARRRQS